MNCTGLRVVSYASNAVWEAPISTEINDPSG